MKEGRLKRLLNSPIADICMRANHADCVRRTKERSTYTRLAEDTSLLCAAEGREKAQQTIIKQGVLAVKRPRHKKMIHRGIKSNKE
jgi:hypothetical protein